MLSVWPFEEEGGIAFLSETSMDLGVAVLYFLPFCSLFLSSAPQRALPGDWCGGRTSPFTGAGEMKGWAADLPFSPHLMSTVPFSNPTQLVWPSSPFLLL